MGDSFIKYPVYIVSKGRYENPRTARYFKSENVDFRIVVEPQEYDRYCETVGEQYVLKLPFSNLGLGSFPARNFCWEHSIQLGAEKHFVFDDNIDRFVMFRKGLRRKEPGLAKPALKCLESFSDRYVNLAISGFNYSTFATTETKKPFYLNVHVYSGMLIRNDLPFRWRLKYNEDVDLCLQALDRKLCTALINLYVMKKRSTVDKIKGGNQTDLYKGNDPQKKILKARSLEMVWPQYAKTTIRFGRPHHFVNWSKHFKHPLIRKPNYDEIVKQQTEVPNVPAS